MAYINGYQGHVFTVFYHGQIILQPEPKTIPNTFDYMGMQIGLPRLPGEKNVDYRQRLFDVYVRRAGAHENGLINGITRELGLEQFEVLTIEPTIGSLHRIIIDDTTIKLYAMQSDYYYQQTINLFKRDQGGCYLDELVATINSTPYFSASLINGVVAHTPSLVLLRHDTQIYIDEPEELLASTRHVLEHNNLLKGSLKFSGQGLDIFSVEKTSEDAVQIAGDYYVDYINGVVISYSKSLPNTFCYYAYSVFPAILMASPVILFDFNSGLLKDEIYDQIQLPDGQYTEGLPKSEAADYINELLSVKGLLWGD